MTTRWIYECRDCGTLASYRVRSRDVTCEVCDGETRTLGEIEFDS